MAGLGSRSAVELNWKLATSLQVRPLMRDGHRELVLVRTIASAAPVALQGPAARRRVQTSELGLADPTTSRLRQKVDQVLVPNLVVMRVTTSETGAEDASSVGVAPRPQGAETAEKAATSPVSIQKALRIDDDLAQSTVGTRRSEAQIQLARAARGDRAVTAADRGSKRARRSWTCPQTTPHATPHGSPAAPWRSSTNRRYKRSDGVARLTLGAHAPNGHLPAQGGLTSQPGLRADAASRFLNHTASGSGAGRAPGDSDGESWARNRPLMMKGTTTSWASRRHRNDASELIEDVQPGVQSKQQHRVFLERERVYWSYFPPESESSPQGGATETAQGN